MIEDYVAPSIKVIKNAFTQTQLFLDTVAQAPDELWMDSSIDAYNLIPEFRKSRELPIPYGLMFPKVFLDLAYMLHQEATIYSKENGLEFTHMEGVSLLEYNPNTDFFDRHRDDGPNQPRAISAILYINDVEKGGETIFDKFDLTISPEAGKLVLFPANFAYTHQAMPPISGKKYAVITFFGMQLSKDIFDNYYAKYAHYAQGTMPS